MKTTFRSLVLAPVVLAAAALATTSAIAETTTVNVPFSFAVSGKSLPAGRYSVERDQARTFVKVINKETPAGFALLLAPGAAAQNENKVTMHFDKNNQSYTLQSIQIGSQITRQKKGATHTEHQPVDIVAGQ